VPSPLRRPAPSRPPLVLAVLALAGMLTGCAGDADPAGTTYGVVQVTGHELATGSDVVLAFTEDSVGTQPGCNAFTAPARWDDGTLELEGEPAGTRMACSPDLMAQDQWFTAFLGSSPTLTFEGEELVLAAGEVTVRLAPRAD